MADMTYTQAVKQPKLIFQLENCALTPLFICLVIAKSNICHFHRFVGDLSHTKMTDSKYFTTTKKGEIFELKSELNNDKKEKKKEAVKKVGV